MLLHVEVAITDVEVGRVGERWHAWHSRTGATGEGHTDTEALTDLKRGLEGRMLAAVAVELGLPSSGREASKG